MEITQRTLQGRLLLRPTPELCRIVNGILGRAQQLFDMTIHAFIFLSNHYHLILSPKDARQQANFMGYLSGNLAREVGRLADWHEKVWGRRYAHVPITEEPEAQIERLRYVLAQGVKEGLVAQALDWPGASSLPALLDGSMICDGLWYDRTTSYRAQRAGLDLGPDDWIQSETVVLTPLPALAHLSAEHYAAAILRMVTEIEQAAAEGTSASRWGRQPSPPSTRTPRCLNERGRRFPWFTRRRSRRGRPSRRPIAPSSLPTATPARSSGQESGGSPSRKGRSLRLFRS